MTWVSKRSRSAAQPSKQRTGARDYFVHVTLPDPTKESPSSIYLDAFRPERKLRGPPGRRAAAAAPQGAGGKAWPTVWPVAGGTASVAVTALAGGPVRFHPRFSPAEVAIAAALPNRELREPTLFLVSFYPRELRPDERPVNRALFQFDRRLTARLAGHVSNQLRDSLPRVLTIVHVAFAAASARGSNRAALTAAARWPASYGSTMGNQLLIDRRAAAASDCQTPCRGQPCFLSPASRT